jgi:large subunit ribosomal protein L21
MKYAVIKTGGKQYKVREGDTIRVEKLNKASSRGSKTKDKLVEFDQVLLFVDDGKAKIGQPTLKARVKGKVVEDGKSEKIHVFKYKAKTGYHRKVGHRQPFTKVLIENIALA